MSTKRLSRSVIEGGRVGSNKSERRVSNNKQRLYNRKFSRDLRILVDPDEGPIAPKRKSVGKDFDDKLGAMYRWLRSKVGLNWNDSFQDMCAKFDTRTIAGRHIVYSHILGSITISLFDIHKEYGDFFVDNNGILRLADRNKWNRKNSRHKDIIPFSKIGEWASANRVMEYNSTNIFWMKPEVSRWAECHYKYSGCDALIHRKGTKLVNVPSHSVLAIEKDQLPKEVINGVILYFKKTVIREHLCGSIYKQGARFSSSDYDMWNKLSEYQKQRIRYK